MALFVGVSPPDAWLQERWRKRLSSSSATTTTDTCRKRWEILEKKLSSCRLMTKSVLSHEGAEDDLVLCRMIKVNCDGNSLAPHTGSGRRVCGARNTNWEFLSSTPSPSTRDLRHLNMTRVLSNPQTERRTPPPFPPSFPRVCRAQDSGYAHACELFALTLPPSDIKTRSRNVGSVPGRAATLGIPLLGSRMTRCECERRSGGLSASQITSPARNVHIAAPRSESPDLS